MEVPTRIFVPTGIVKNHARRNEIVLGTYNEEATKGGQEVLTLESGAKLIRTYSPQCGVEWWVSSSEGNADALYDALTELRYLPDVARVQGLVKFSEDAERRRQPRKSTEYLMNSGRIGHGREALVPGSPSPSARRKGGRTRSR